MSFFSRIWSRFGDRAPLRPRIFSNQNFIRIPVTNKVEEETLPDYLPARYYPVRIGEVFIGRYQVVGKLGFGASSTVWLANDLRLFTLCTPTIIHPSFIRSQALGDHVENEMNMYKRMEQRASTHPGRSAVRTLLDSFQIKGPDGDHLVLAHPPLLKSIEATIRRSSPRRLRPFGARYVLKDLFMALEYLHDDCQIIHTDIKADNIMFSITDPSVFTEFEEEEMRDPCPRKEVDGRTIYTSRTMKSTDKMGPPVLCDFGSAVLGDSENVECVQPNVYRSPEVTLEAPWDYKIDIWNVGCMVWDIFEGNQLFHGIDPEHHEYRRRAHLAEIVALLGPPPKELLARGKLAHKFFSDEGKKDTTMHPISGTFIGGIDLPASKSLDEIETLLEGDEKKQFLEFMRKMLQWAPERRISERNCTLIVRIVKVQYIAAQLPMYIRDGLADEAAQLQPAETHTEAVSTTNNQPDGNGASNLNNTNSSNALYSLLTEAVDDDDAMRKLVSRWEDLKTMVNIPCPYYENKTSLHLAAQKGFKEVVEKLLKDGAGDPSMADEDGWRPLHFACRAGNNDVVDELLLYKADPTLTDNLGFHLFHITCAFGQPATFNHIVERYSELFQQNTTPAGFTPIHLAILFNDEAMIITCLDKGADIYAKDSYGQTTLMMATYAKDKGKTETLIDRLKNANSDLFQYVNTCCNEGKTPLVVACEEGWAEGVNVLGQAGANYNSRDYLGRLALHYSITYGDLSIVETITKETDPKHLLMADENGESAFDDFDFNQATDQIKQWRSIQHVIYGKGPARVAEDMMKTWFPYPKTEPKASEIPMPDTEILTRLKWIHLPVTNMVWMEDELNLLEDAATDRPSGDDKDANSKTEIKKFKGQDQSNLLGISAAYMPYFSMSNWVPSSIKRLNERERLYNRLLDVYKDDALLQSATLDESYYHLGSNKASRADQEAQWVITATSHAVDELQEDDVLKDFLNHPDIHEQITEAASQPGFAARVATLIANYCVDAYGRKRSSEHVDTSQDSDSSSSNSHVVREELSTRSIRQLFSDIANENAIEEKRLFADITIHRTRSRSRKKGNDDKLESIPTEASQLACDIKYLRDELDMLRSIVNSQLTVQKKMPGNTKGSSSIKGQYFSKDLEELENVAKRTQESVDTILTLAETEIANDQARQATRQGRTMMVFTVVTILFLPLSFLSSLFALSDKPFAETPSCVHVIIWAVSFTFCVPVACISLFSDASAKQWNRIWSSMEQIATKHWRDFQGTRGDKKEEKESKKADVEKKKKNEAWKKDNDRLRKKEDDLKREREVLMNNRPDISPV
ncbi:hypothetical protein HYE68_005358 [Fusarium pseudograminearum]|nr:hypothetical protein HYE68_005358 [Fusarium pseudograminearum]